VLVNLFKLKQPDKSSLLLPVNPKKYGAKAQKTAAPKIGAAAYASLLCG